jgi:hypothetical protein
LVIFEKSPSKLLSTVINSKLNVVDATATAAAAVAVVVAVNDDDEHAHKRISYCFCDESVKRQFYNILSLNVVVAAVVIEYLLLIFLFSNDQLNRKDHHRYNKVEF